MKNATFVSSFQYLTIMKKILLFFSAALLMCSCGDLNPKANKDVDNKDSIATVVENLCDEIDTIGIEEVDTVDSAIYEPEFLDIEEIPETADRQDYYFQYAVYVNLEQEPGEFDLDGVYSVWLADERMGTVIKVLTTNPNAEGQWEKMSGKNSNAVEVPMDQIATASTAYLAPGDVSMIIVEGCPDARNIWTYFVDPYANTAKQLPSTEGVQNLDWDKKEIVVSSYGYYPEGGRYTYSCAYSLDGKFLRQTSEPQPE